jgi:signal transduction histidine kinase
MQTAHLSIHPLSTHRQPKAATVLPHLSPNIKESPLACSTCGIAYVGAMIGGLIQQRRPLPIVLAALCRLLDAAAEGYTSSVLLFDRSRTQIRHAIGPGLPSAYTRLLEGLPVIRDHRARDGTRRDKPEKIISRLMCDILREDNGQTIAHIYGFKSCWWWPILSLTGEPLGVLAIYQREAGGYSPFPPVLIHQLTDIASIAIERTRSEESVRRSEVLLAKAQRLSSTGSFSWCVATDELTWSEELYRIFEFNPAESVRLEQVITRIHPEDLPSFHALVERARRGGGDLDWEHRLLMPDCSVKYLHLVADGTRDQDGQLEYIGAIQDITERRLSEQALDKLRTELAHVTRVTSLGALTASIAHEVNQPLLGIITNASSCLRVLAADPPDLEIARETARRAIRDSQRASDVITRLRALFSKRGVTKELLDLNEAIREVIALLFGELQRRGAVVQVELYEGLPPVVGDCVQLQQVILNLVMNAAEAMSDVNDRARRLTIRTELSRGHRVRLSVQDAGIGISHQDASKLFDAFYSTKSDGMGIGLSVSRSIVEHHRGQLWAEANPGFGATFSFSIPCPDEDVSESGVARTVRTTAQAERGAGTLA